MLWSLFFGLILAAAVIRSEFFWEGLCGLALFGIAAGVAQLDVGLILFSLGTVAVCVVRWRFV